MIGGAVGLTALAAAGGLALHRLFEGEALPLDLVDQWRIGCADIAALDRRLREHPARSELVVSLTTIPSRLPFLKDTLVSLMLQRRPPAAIILNLPDWSRRESMAYVVPDWLKALSSVTLRRCPDWGPATKLIPTVQDSAPDQPIVVVDDDRLYPPGLIADLEAAARRHPDCALGFSGWVIPADLTDRPTTIMSNLLMRPPAPLRATRLRTPREVDVLQGMSGYLIRRWMLEPLADLTDYAQAPAEAFFVDDVWISGHCHARKLVIPAPRLGFEPWHRRRFYTECSLGRRNRGGGVPELRPNTIVLRHLAGRWQVGGAPSSGQGGA